MKKQMQLQLKMFVNNAAKTNLNNIKLNVTRLSYSMHDSLGKS